jgi:glutamyl/glutaminyl-tRNA synthetase
LERSPDGGFTAEALKQAVWPYAEKKGRGDVLWPLRVALTGQERSPDPFASAALLGKEESLRRIDAAIRRCAS